MAFQSFAPEREENAADRTIVGDTLLKVRGLGLAGDEHAQVSRGVEAMDGPVAARASELDAFERLGGSTRGGRDRPS